MHARPRPQGFSAGRSSRDFPAGGAVILPWTWQREAAGQGFLKIDASRGKAVGWGFATGGGIRAAL